MRLENWETLFEDLERGASRLKGQRKLKKLALIKKYRKELKTNSRRFMHRGLEELDKPAKELAADMVNSETELLTKMGKSFGFDFAIDKKSRLRSFMEAVEELREDAEPVTRHPKEGISMLIDQSHAAFQLVEDNLHLPDEKLIDLFIEQENEFMEEWNKHDFEDKASIADPKNPVFRERARRLIQGIRDSNEPKQIEVPSGFPKLVDGYFEILNKYEKQILDSDPNNEDDLIEEMWIDYSLFIAQMDDPNIEFNPDNEDRQKGLLKTMFEQVREDGGVPDKETVLGALRSL